MPIEKTIKAMKAARRGELVTVGSTDELLASLNADDHVTISVSPKAFSVFEARLNAPPKVNKRLRRALKTRALWEKK